MDTFDPSKLSQIRKIVDQFGGAKKSLGQNFLISDTVVKKMVAHAEINEKDTILEIGPGLGVLTEELVHSPAKEIILIEKDDKFHGYLAERFKNKAKVIRGDILILINDLMVNEPFKIIANLPYNISQPVIISALTVCPTLPSRIVIMLQKEVVDRLLAKPGDSNRGILTVFIELFGETKLVTNVSRNLFYPAPHVDSAIIDINNIKMPDVEPKKAFKIIKMAFANKRKKIKNSLFSTLKLSTEESQVIARECNFDLDQRPEELKKEQWVALIKIVNKLIS